MGRERERKRTTKKLHKEVVLFLTNFPIDSKTVSVHRNIIEGKKTKKYLSFSFLS